MTREELLEVLEVQELAMSDPEYLDLHKQYGPSQDRFAELLESLSLAEQAVVEDYLTQSTHLFYRLMVMAVHRHK